MQKLIDPGQGSQYIVRKTPQGIEMITPEMLPKNITTLMNQAASSSGQGGHDPTDSNKEAYPIVPRYKQADKSCPR